jgi:electron transport complex protein RnfE
MSCIECRQTLAQGLWGQNQALVALLGLCPLLAVSNTLINGFGLGVASLLTLLFSNVLIASVARFIPNETRLPVFVLIIASVVTFIEFYLQAYHYLFYQTVGLFIPLIVTNCVILARAEAVASRQNIAHSLLDALAMGSGFTLVLMVLGALREMLGFGTLMSGAEVLFGEVAQAWEIRLMDADNGFLFAILPPGAFMGLALLIATRNYLVQRKQQQLEAVQPTSDHVFDE